MRDCKQCGLPVKNRVAIYCSNKCQSDFEYITYIKKWKNGESSGGIGIQAKNLSGHVRKYIASKFGNACSICNWSEINIYTNKVPLEIDHIDGNSENNTEDNLRVICPNCHALTPSFRNLNRGKGRVWRRNKYTKN